MSSHIELKRNVNKNYIYILLQNLDLTRGIWMIYLVVKGMNLIQIGLLEAVFHIAYFAMEVPTGAIADLYGRKVSRILGGVAALISTIILLASNDFYWFTLAFIVSALSYNLESGAGNALIYDSLKEVGEEKEYMKISGNIEVFRQTAKILSFLVGGYLATKSYSFVFIIAIIIGIISVMQAFTFIEPSIGKAHNEKGNSFIMQLRESIKIIVKNSRLSFLIIFVEVIAAFCTSMFLYLQNYFKGDGYNEALIGIVYAIASLATAIAASQTHKIEKIVKERGLLIFVPFITVACIWGVALSKYHFVYFVILMITQGIICVAIGDYINKMIPSENRATILSFSSMLFSFFMITIFPLMGFIGNEYSLIVAFKFIAILGSILAIINSYILISKVRNVAEETNNLYKTNKNEAI